MPAQKNYDPEFRRLWSDYAKKPTRAARLALFRFYRPMAKAIVARKLGGTVGALIPATDARQIVETRLWETIPKVKRRAYTQPRLAMSYIKQRVSGALLDEARRIAGRDLVRPAHIPYDESTCQTPAVSLSQGEAVVDARDQVEHLLGKIPVDEASVVRLMALEGMNATEAARKLGLPRSTVQHRYAAGLVSLKRAAAAS